MFISIFGKSLGKIQNENDMLGFLITHMDSNHNVGADVILKEAGIDNLSCYALLKSLESSHYIIYTYDTMTVLSLGELNYRSPLKKLLLWILKLLILTIKNLIIYIAGILSGLIVAYLSYIFIQ